MKFIRKLRKLVKPPTPVELGRTKHNALPSRMFDPFEAKFCWEDWEEEVKREYPVRYFLGKTVPHWFAVKITMRLRDWKWKIIDFFKRPHMLDMRYPGEYGGGYVDPCHAMLVANFKLLGKYIAEEPYNLRDDYSDEEIDDQGLRAQQDHYDEAMALWRYWTVERKELEAGRYASYDKMKQAGKEGDKERYEELREEWLSEKDEYGRDERDRVEDEMLGRLIKIRRGLWT